MKGEKLYDTNQLEGKVASKVPLRLETDVSKGNRYGIVWLVPGTTGTRVCGGTPDQHACIGHHQATTGWGNMYVWTNQSCQSVLGINNICFRRRYPTSTPRADIFVAFCALSLLYHRSTSFQ